MQNDKNYITILLLGTTFLIFLMGIVIIIIIFLYRKRQIAYLEKINNIQAINEKELLATKIEIQEQTFQHISREIHDNISLSLTLAKLHLNTVELNDKTTAANKMNLSIDLISRSIMELSDISKSLNAEFILAHGLLKAIDEELECIRQTGKLILHYNCIGTEQFLDSQKELIIFRIIQEAFNNIIKHAEAKTARLLLKYDTHELYIRIEDDGNGFNTNLPIEKEQAGLMNMRSRTKLLQGVMTLNSQTKKGTSININIPIT